MPYSRPRDQSETGEALDADLRTLLEAVLDAVLSHNVQACVVVHGAANGAEADQWLTRGPDAVAAAELEAFVRQSSPVADDGADMPGPGGPPPHLGRCGAAGTEHILAVSELVGADAEVIGRLGIAFDCHSWEVEAVRKFCTVQARLLVKVIEAWQARQSAEIDLMEESRRVQLFRRTAELDPLTHVENAITFKLKAQDRLQGDTGATALILLDIDHFKAVNDIYGHQFGDQYLKSIAEAIQRTFTSNALIGRIGGDEFAILLPCVKNSTSYVQRMMALCSSSIQRSAARLGQPDLGRVSMGASQFPQHANNYGRLFDLADAALYASKSSGRATNTIFRADQHEGFNNRLLQTRFEAAIARGEVVPFFQPIVCMNSGDWRGFEVLARWRDPRRGLLAPSSFGQVLGNQTMSGQLTHCIVSLALKGFLERCGNGAQSRRYLSINLTTFELMNPEFVFDLQAMLSDAGLDWSSIVIEVTETVMLGEVGGPAYRSLSEMRTRGARVALDDFGTGVGGLKHLKDWPIDILKIDRHFVGQLGPDARDQSVVRAILAIGRDLGLDVVAEGIETVETRDMLTDLGCFLGQGYLFARPFPVEALRLPPSAPVTASSAT
ncbi:diguanylate cyclase/phosphodiesterase (GGDEF & EAL domains) with PAS/PAC sensor(s) [Rhodovulum sp. P5]|uniref:putative bifunctional diguanylate cyclase/phosphodiesterase n=1 Tax=Rhodovulum sp. P5 TaxID=1564506 RepID=UPI0009C22F66|nr:bifunctional diguanylate cyclase/phosphodiesterase [Rhodovulum sp. P5]ARE40993.1 diguanylate cyclase/phosphodiesterase (GGDEF & EAL domains) with PAS/PAC sensor(s) [Rhodovulum sp. P5]